MDNNPIVIPTSEGERRLRAAVRVLMSRGVWSVIAAQLGLILLWRRVLSDDTTAASIELFVLAIALAGFLYITAGVSQALAASRDLVGLRAGLRAGTTCYGPFLWMIAKLVLLGGMLLNIAILATGGTGGASAATEFSQKMPGFIPLVQGLLGFVFVYWLPIVFVRRDFALFKTLGAALVTAWQRLPHAGYLAILTLTPALIALIAGDTMPLFAVLLINLVGGAMEWVAYAYCVGSLQDASRG